MADSDSLVDEETEGGETEDLKSGRRIKGSVLESLKELVRRLGEVLKWADHEDEGTKAEEGQMKGSAVQDKKSLGSEDAKCDAPTPAFDYGGAQSFAEVDAWMKVSEQRSLIGTQARIFESVISNILKDEDLSMAEKATKVAVAAAALPGRVENPPEYKALELGEKAVQGIKFVVGRRKGKTTTDLQTVIFDKQNWDTTKARAWLEANNLHAGKLDETENSLRFRQAEPSEFQEGSFRTIQPGQSKKSGLKLFKDRTGATRWVSFSANAFRDKEGEIFSTKALEEAVEEADRSDQRGPLLLYHVPVAEIGQCDFQALEGRILVESGTFADTALGRKAAEYFLAHAADEFEMSVGYKYRREDREDKVYDWVRIFERSITPVGAAANSWTSFSAIKEASMDEKRRKLLEDVLGPELAGDVIERAQNETKALEDDVAFKTSGEEPEPKSEVEGEESKPEGEGKEPEPKPEGEEPGVAESEKSVSLGELTEMLKGVLGPVLDEVKSVGDRLTVVEGQSTKTAEAIKALAESDDEKISSLLRPRVGVPALAGKSATAGGGEELTEEEKKSLEEKGGGDSADPTDPYLAQLTGKRA